MWKQFTNDQKAKRHRHIRWGFRLGTRIKQAAYTSRGLAQQASRARLRALQCLERKLSCNTPLLPPMQGSRRLEFSSAIKNQWQPVI